MNPTASLATHPSRRTRRGAPALLLSLVLVIATPAAGAQPPVADDPGVITAWNAVAASIVPGNPAAFLSYAFVHLAMYNAVNGITGEYALYQWNVRGPAKASTEAAAAAAAHRVLMTYFGGVPSVADTLDAALAGSLAKVPDGARKDQRVRYGLRAADRIIELRVGDGRNAPVEFPTATKAGDWIGTVFAVPWLGQVRPLALDSLTRFDPGAPPAIGSPLYRQELAEVRAVGAADASGGARSLAEELTARYFADIPFGPMQAGLRKVAMDLALDISDSARLFAATNTSIADAIGTAWKAKLKYMWWRPISAIREVFDDGDAATVPDPSWNSLLAAPPYPEWPSGLCSVVGAVTTSLERLTGGVNLTVVSPSQGPRTWTSKSVLDQTAVDARIWSGIHFRTSDVVAIGIGTQSANYVLDRYFAPTH